MALYARWDGAENCWELPYGPWGLGPIRAVSEVKLHSEVIEDILMLWDEYALADDDTLTPGAQELKRELLACFEPA